MDARQAFQIGFLAYCADHGLSGPEAKALSEKAAGLLEGPLSTAKEIGSAVKGVSPMEFVKAHWPWLLGGAVLVPGLAGGLAGHLAANAAHGTDYDEDDVKTQEKIELMRREAAKAKALGGLA
jgi:hypothetical protein